MFRGVNNINMDAKGRVALPTRFRELVHDSCDGRLVITIDMDDKCLLIYPISQWEEIERKISSGPSLNKLTRRMQRLLIGHATDVELDASDRILIPPPLRQYAELDKKVVLIGQGKKLELWSEMMWEDGRDEWLQDGSASLDDLPDEIASISF